MKKATKTTGYHKETLKKWTPSFMLKIGVTINIAFCALLSIPIFTLPLTIPAIVLNALLLVPRVDTKRYHAVWKYVPIALTLFLVAIVWFIVFFSVAALEGLLNDFVTFINTYVIFWTKNGINENIEISAWLEVFEIILLSVGTSGSIFIIFGWYWGKEIGEVEVKDSKADVVVEEKKTNASKDIKPKSTKKEKPKTNKK